MAAVTEDVNGGRGHPEHLRRADEEGVHDADPRIRYPTTSVEHRQGQGSRSVDQPAPHLALLQPGLSRWTARESKQRLQFEITRQVVKRKEVMHFSLPESACSSKQALHRHGRGEYDRRGDGASSSSVSVEWSVQLGAASTFAAAAAATPRAFPRYDIAVLESAELTETLDKVLNELADYIERDIDALIADHRR